MSFSIRIRYRDQLVIPKESGFVPPMHNYPTAISLSVLDMSTIVNFMRISDVIDITIDRSALRKNCDKHRVPIYKFVSNNGYSVTAREAFIIAKGMDLGNLFQPKCLRANFPNYRPKKDQQKLLRARQLVELWIAFNHVAASNNGYTVH